MWDTKTKELQHIHTFNEYIEGFQHFALMEVPEQHILLMMGGCNIRGALICYEVDRIYRYCIRSRIWKKLDTKLPHPMHKFGYVMTKGERYIIIMGGTGFTYYQDRIFVARLSCLKFFESQIKLPFEGRCKAIIMENNQKKDLLMHGFIRKEMVKNNILIPSSLIDLFITWHSLEYVHVFNNEGNHWKIQVVDIIGKTAGL